METMTYLLLCLPPLLGGYGLPKPVINEYIELDEQGRIVARRGHCEGDLCWKDQRLNVEYHGDVHVGMQHMKDDVGRTLGIEHMEIRVITLTSQQVFDTVQFEVVAKEVAKALGKRLYPRVLGDTPSRRALRADLEEWMFR
jgi:hypothetical protein